MCAAANLKQRVSVLKFFVQLAWVRFSVSVASARTWAGVGRMATSRLRGASPLFGGHAYIAAARLLLVGSGRVGATGTDFAGATQLQHLVRRSWRLLTLARFAAYQWALVHTLVRVCVGVRLVQPRDCWRAEYDVCAAPQEGLEGAARCLCACAAASVRSLGLKRGAPPPRAMRQPRSVCFPGPVYQGGQLLARAAAGNESSAKLYGLSRSAQNGSAALLSVLWWVNTHPAHA